MSNSEFRIEKNVPMPEKTTLPEMPFDQLQVGDSFKVTLREASDKGTVRQRMHRFQRNNPPIRLSLRTIDKDTLRVYRVEDRT